MALFKINGYSQKCVISLVFINLNTYLILNKIINQMGCMQQKSKPKIVDKKYEIKASEYIDKGGNENKIDNRETYDPLIQQLKASNHLDINATPRREIQTEIKANSSRDEYSASPQPKLSQEEINGSQQKIDNTPKGILKSPQHKVTKSGSFKNQVLFKDTIHKDSIYKLMKSKSHDKLYKKYSFKALQQIL
ncbi:hypothetical protein pb186bvf_002832 [Paramecium bursaria]